MTRCTTSSCQFWQRVYNHGYNSDGRSVNILFHIASGTYRTVLTIITRHGTLSIPDFEKYQSKNTLTFWRGRQRSCNRNFQGFTATKRVKSAKWLNAIDRAIKVNYITIKNRPRTAFEPNEIQRISVRWHWWSEDSIIDAVILIIPKHTKTHQNTPKHPQTPQNTTKTHLVQNAIIMKCFWVLKIVIAASLPTSKKYQHRDVWLIYFRNRVYKGSMASDYH